MRKAIIAWVLMVLALLAACQTKPVAGENVSVAGGTYTNISADELDNTLKTKDFVLVNVHIPFAGNIAGTDLSIPYDQIQQNLTMLPTDKGTKLVLYCRSGRMSQIAAEELVALGYTNVWNLKDGMLGWEQAGYDLER